jgi:1-acyl-sn-glycerol-3-phosphate acyltransferase
MFFAVSAAVMAIDGFNSEHAHALQGLSPAMERRFYAFVDRLARRLRVEVEGVERVPARRALLVANHAFGFDIVFPMAAIYRETGRHVWTLGEHAWWKFPFVRRLAAGIGTVDGTPANADHLLARDELLLVLPGGLREAMKPHELRYRLLWGRRYGFIRTAIRNGAPIVPLAAVGSDEIFDLVGDAFARSRRLFGRYGFFPLPRPSFGLPIPHFVKLRYVFGAPIELRARPEEADDPEVQRHARLEVEGALQELIDVELARRAGIDIEPCEPATSRASG